MDGSRSNPSERTESSTTDGKPIKIDPLHQGAQANIVRVRMIGDGGQYVSNDQLVVTTTGEGNDQIKVSQRSDGAVEVNVNDETHDVKLAERQELTLRVGTGDDVVEVAPNVRVNIVVDGDDGDDALTVGEGRNFIEGGTGNDQISADVGKNQLSRRVSVTIASPAVAKTPFT